jgi:glucose-1-phosphate adenylyltransferase
MLAAILAGGKGTRMDVFCQVRSKPALSFAGKYSFIDFCLSNCLHSQISDIAILVDYQRAHLTKYLERWQNDNSMKNAFDVLEPSGNNFYSGSTNAIYQNLDYLRKQPVSRVLIMPSDHAYKMDYRKMLEFHDKSKADITVGVVPVPIEEAHRFGTLTLGENGYVTEYVEKPDIPKSNLVSMGIYIFNKDVLMKRIIEDAEQTASVHDFGYSIIPGMVGRDRVYGYQYDDFWRDIGTIDAYYETSMELAGTKPPFSLSGTWPILTCANNEPIKKYPSSVIENSIISPGCVIKGRVENSILSPGVQVDEHAVVKNSILMSNVSVGLHSVVDSCIADEEVNIGKFCYVGFGNNGDHKAECTLLGKGASIISHTAIARGCKVMPYSNPTESARKVFLNDYHAREAVQLQPQISSQTRITA